jgi:hypothetical protein
MCYVVGGRPPGSNHTNPGCRDKTPPSNNQPLVLHFELYFAGNSANWRGAPAFVRRSNNNFVTLGRMYLITDDQFNDVVMQENDRPVNGARFVPSFDDLMKHDEFELPGNRLYGHLFRVGEQNGWPIFTFTTRRELPINVPTKAYIEVIVAGIKETYPAMPDAQICEYLMGKQGIKDRISPHEITSWVKESR